MLKTAKTKYQRTAPDLKRRPALKAPEERHANIDKDMRRLRAMAQKKGGGANLAKQFNARRRILLKRLTEHRKKLNSPSEKENDPNAGYVPNYIKQLLKIQRALAEMDYPSLQAAEEEDVSLDAMPEGNVSEMDQLGQLSDDEMRTFEQEDSGELAEEEEKPDGEVAETEEAEEEEQKEEEEEEQEPAPDPQALEFAKQWAELEPLYLKALREGRGDASRLRALNGYVQGKAELDDFGSALIGLHNLDRAVREALGLPPPPPPPPPKPPPAPEKTPQPPPRPADPAEGRFRAKLRTVMQAHQRLVQALPDRKAALEPLVASVTAAGRDGQFTRGLAAVDQLEAALKETIRAAAASPAEATADEDAAHTKALEARFKERLRALGAQLPRALQDARKSDPTRAEQIEELQARAFDLARARAYEEGLEVLDGLAAVMEGVKPPPADNAAARFKTRLQRVSGEYRQAVTAAGADLTRATQLTELFTGAARAARAGEYDKALQTLDELEAAVKAALRNAAAAEEVKKATGGNNVAFVKSKLAWDRGRKDAAAALRAYQASILTDPDVTADPRYNEIKRIVIGLNKALAHFDGSINDALDAAANATNEADKQKAAKEALSQVARYRARLEGNAAIKAMEQGAFGSAGVYQRLSGALDELSRHLSR
jgi:hypothetical protein